MPGRSSFPAQRLVPRRLAALLLGLGLLASPLLAPARLLARTADPALWVVRDADTTLYLFGTVHLLPKDLVWFDGAVARAFQASDELTLELPPQEDPAALAPLILRLAVDPGGRTMAQRLSAKDHAAYVAALERIGLPAASLEPLEPWFIAITAASVLYARAGLDPQSGAEAVLTQAARRSGKTITAFETPEEQFSLFDATPEAEQLAGLRELIDRPDQGLAVLRRLLEHWARGEAEDAGRLMNESLKNTPATARLLLSDRNARWAQRLKQRLARPGVVFVAVGAGHLSGANSVPELLRKAGLQVERVRP
jgi:uncharacterized protein YbaP (TraB family)